MRANPNETLPRRVDTFVPPGSQVTVTIGRNLGSEPMSPHDWADFQSLTTQAARDLLAPTLTFGPFTGSGEWDDVVEESAVFIFVSHYPASVRAVESKLVAVASEFGQDAIAWSFGPNLLATP